MVTSTLPNLYQSTAVSRVNGANAKSASTLNPKSDFQFYSLNNSIAKIRQEKHMSFDGI